MSDIKWIQDFPPEIISLFLKYLPTYTLFFYKDSCGEWFDGHVETELKSRIRNVFKTQSHQEWQYHNIHEFFPISTDEYLDRRPQLQVLAKLWKEAFGKKERRLALECIQNEWARGFHTIIPPFIADFFKELNCDKFELTIIAKFLGTGATLALWLTQWNQDIVKYILFEGIQPVPGHVFPMNKRVQMFVKLFGQDVQDCIKEKLSKPCPWHSHHIDSCPYILEPRLLEWLGEDFYQSQPGFLPEKSLEEMLDTHDSLAIYSSLHLLGNVWDTLVQTDRFTIIRMIGNIFGILGGEFDLDRPFEEISRVLQTFVSFGLNEKEMMILLADLRPRRLEDLQTILTKFSRNDLRRMLWKSPFAVWRPSHAEYRWEFSVVDGQGRLDECHALMSLNLSLPVFVMEPQDYTDLVLDQYRRNPSQCFKLTQWLWEDDWFGDDAGQIIGQVLTQLELSPKEFVNVLYKMVPKGGKVNDWDVGVVEGYKTFCTPDDLIEILHSLPHFTKTSKYSILLSRIGTEEEQLVFLEKILQFGEIDVKALSSVCLPMYDEPTLSKESTDWRSIDSHLFADDCRMAKYLQLLEKIIQDWKPWMKQVYLEQYSENGRGIFIGQVLGRRFSNEMDDLLKDFGHDEFAKIVKKQAQFAKKHAERERLSEIAKRQEAEGLQAEEEGEEWEETDASLQD